ncbi:hypothetical protein ACSSV5_001075 [Psychroflexus sp. MBR-150]
MNIFFWNLYRTHDVINRMAPIQLFKTLETIGFFIAHGLNPGLWFASHTVSQFIEIEKSLYAVSRTYGKFNLMNP